MDLSRICYLWDRNDRSCQTFVMIDSDSPDSRSETIERNMLHLMTLNGFAIGQVEKILSVFCSRDKTTKRFKFKVDLYALKDRRGKRIKLEPAVFVEEEAAMVWLRYQVLQAELKLIDYAQAKRYFVMK